MTHLIEYGFDTSAFNRILDGKTGAADFIDKLRDRNGRVILSENVLVESLCAAPDRSIGRGRVLAAIASTLGEREIRFAISLSRLFAREMGDEIFTHTPVLPFAESWPC